ncbi:probable calcium-binding protein CML36 [Chenopodium quinoa]|uniref:EF-hand domain-containing protein n=1 Tax=Chenopodium quinoa TaxID=63459 RepID=A0A803MAN7_CHEQI|nr:probable calcium-binding protein CML36 [Chenopodium quinoa]
MKQLLKSMNPKQIFRSKKPKSSPSITKSEPPSFGSTSYSSSTSSDSSTHRRSGPAPGRTKSEDISLRPDPWTEEAFKMIDLDGDGKITRVELHSLFKRVRVNAPSLSEEEVAAMIKDIDMDGDGCISLKELEAVGSALDPTAANEEDLKGAFDFFDSDHDGKISASELHAGFVALGDERCTLEDCRRMIEGVDINNDGFVCFQDFSRMMSIPR